jgi:type I restriction enzyme M protein
VLFIDASNEFKKEKNQNVLHPEHIEKILDTYQQRVAIDKYSHVATLEEIKSNDYNLNIPRYVDTFEEEEEIDLLEVRSKLDEVDKEIEHITKEINEYLKELGEPSIK